MPSSKSEKSASAMTLSQKIKEITNGKDLSEIEELILDGIKSTTVSGLTDEFSMLSYLSMINVGLTSLTGFPYLPNLEELELSDNKISGGLDIIVKQCPKLSRLNLSGNRIKSVDTVSCLVSALNLHCFSSARNVTMKTLIVFLL
ncbi:hypothetical protein GJ496_010509 [Pomphorhynchus laevis]|nr:hypothetical protein GJ496_010509 [Pomphorhynchus laevis]